MLQSVARAADSIGLLERIAARRLEGGSCWLVLMYHRILAPDQAPPPDHGMQVDADIFRAQLEFVRERFEVLAVGETIKRMTHNRPLPARLASLTFDDGYADNLTVAAPLLAAAGLPWSLYVPTGGLAEASPLWWDRAIAVLEAMPSGPLDLRSFGLGQFGKPEQVPGSQRRSWVERMMARLWALPLDTAMRIVESMELRLNGAPIATPRRLTPEQIAALAAQGVEIGSHTHTHQNLALTARGKITADVRRGRMILEDICGRPIPGFAYPSGFVHPGVAAAIRDAGCEYALAVDNRLNLSRVDRFRIQRIGMPNAPISRFKLSLARQSLRRPRPAIAGIAPP